MLFRIVDLLQKLEAPHSSVMPRNALWESVESAMSQLLLLPLLSHPLFLKYKGFKKFDKLYHVTVSHNGAIRKLYR